jgi:hypothetical protein
MVIGTGREFAAQKIGNFLSSTSTLGDTRNHLINSFGIGSGGSIIDGSGEILYKGPKTCDTNLYIPVPINDNCFTYNGFQNIVKEILSVGKFGREAGSIEIIKSENDEFRDCGNLYTVLKAFCVIDEAEPIYEPFKDVIKIDEAMLFATIPNTTNTERKPIPFAHVCFPPKYIELKTKLYLEWYILF